MKLLRLIRGATKIDRMRSKEIKRNLGGDSVLLVIKKGRLRWYGHMKSMYEGKY